MPAELRGLQDFYKPPTAGDAITFIQGQQHLAMQQQQVEQQNKNMDIDNLQKAYTTANPMETYPIAKQLFEHLGMPVPDVNKYYANTQLYDNLLKADPNSPEGQQSMATWLGTDPRSRAAVEKEVNSQRAFLGAQELNTMAGAGGSENMAALTQQSPAVQSQMTNALAQSPLQQEEARALAVKRQEHDSLVTRMKPEMNALATLSRVAARGIENATPLVEQMQPIEEKYLKDQKRLGAAAASKARDEAIAINPALTKFHQDREQAVQSLQAGLDALHQKEDAASLHLQKIGLGTENLQSGESLEKLQGDLSAMGHQINFTNKHLAMAQDPSPANLQAVAAMKTGLDTRLKELETTKASSEEGLAIRRNAQLETARKNQFDEGQIKSNAKGQSLLLEAVGRGENMNAAAARIGAQVGVPASELKKALMDPNKPLTQVNIGQEKAEAQTVGHGFGEQFLESQKAGQVATGTLTRLDRMDELLQGTTTGKLTPSMTELQALGESIGVKVDASLPAKQAFAALAGEMALQLRNPAGGAGMPGSLSDNDLKFLKSMTPGLAQTNEGNKLIIDTARQVAKRQQVVAKMARDYRKQNGQIDEGFQEKVQTYADAHPLFQGRALPEETLKEAGMIAPYHDQDKEKAYQEYKKNHTWQKK